VKKLQPFQRQIFKQVGACFGIFAEGVESDSCLCMEKKGLPAKDSAVELFQASLQERLEFEYLSLDQVYSCDETGLRYRIVPYETLAAKSEKSASAMKKQKRATLVCCSNATGMHKPPLELTKSLLFQTFEQKIFTRQLLSSEKCVDVLKYFIFRMVSPSFYSSSKKLSERE